MKQYNVTTIDGVATVYAENLHTAWKQATAIFSDVTDVTFASYID